MGKKINVKFEIIGDSVWMSLKNFNKLIKMWKEEGAIISSKETIHKPKKKGENL